MQIKNQTPLSKLLLISLLSIFLVGCNDELDIPYQEPNYIEFTTSELIVEVTSDIKSFRIEIEGTQEYSEYPNIMIDRDKTSAKHNYHFINTVEPNMGDILGQFTLIPKTKKSYRDVVIIPDNITEEVQIVYSVGAGLISPEDPKPDNLIEELIVTLRPKVEEQ